MQSGVAYKISHNMLPTAVEDARTPKQPGNTGVETSIVPWEASESTPERPEWLPKGWEMKVMTIKNGTTDGVKDWVIQSLCIFFNLFFFLPSIEIWNLRI